MKENGDSKPLIYDVDLTFFANLFEEWKEPKFRAIQLWQGLYQNLWNHPDQFTNFPRSLRRHLEDRFFWNGLKVGSTLTNHNSDTQKTLFYLQDGFAIETVLMNYDRRVTLCISTQSGCGMGCVFCATGKMGFQRNLKSGEIIEQVLFFARHLLSSDNRINNVVIMGMGEPFHNYDNTMSAIRILNHPDGFNLGARRFTISTIGIVPAIHRFTKEDIQVNLAVSLHAADNDLRTTLVPINSKYPIEDIFLACSKYVDSTNRRISFEWTLIHGINDSIEQAEKLAELCKTFNRNGSYLCHVNLIQLNLIQDYPGRTSTSQSADVFRKTLIKHRIPTTIRIRRGIDINAGCGQLASAKLEALL